MLLINCGGGSKFSSNSGKSVTTAPKSPVTPKANGQTNPTYLGEHCKDISAAEHLFHSTTKIYIQAKQAYGLLLQAGGVCSYSYNDSNKCDFWNQQGMGLWLSFHKGYPAQASIAIDATGNGWFNGDRNATPYPVRRMILNNGVIDCSKTDLTINFQTQLGYVQLVAPKEYGNKHTTDLRASLFLSGQKIGTGFLSR